MWLIFDCSAKVVKQDSTSAKAVKQDSTRPEYVCHFLLLVLLTFFSFSRRIKVKTEKAMYAEKVEVDSGLKYDLF